MSGFCENCIGTGEIFRAKPEGWIGSGAWVIHCEPDPCPACGGSGKTADPQKEKDYNVLSDTQKQAEDHSESKEN